MTLKYSWYQTDSQVILEFFVKGVSPEQIVIDLSDDKIYIRIPHLGEEKILHLSHPVSSFQLNTESSKFIVTLEKTTVGINWSSAEVLPNTPSLKRKDWDKIDCEESEEEGKNQQNVEKYFKDLFADAPDDVKKAMIKSYTESGGTVLSTNWSEVANAKVERYDAKKKDNKEF